MEIKKQKQTWTEGGGEVGIQRQKLWRDTHSAPRSQRTGSRLRR